MPKDTRVGQRSATKERYISHEIFGMRHGDAGQSIHLSETFKTIISSSSTRYRNFEMVCTALMDQQSQPLYFPLLDSPIPPSVRNLQRWIEDAWRAGTSLNYHHLPHTYMAA
jgi:hypothetical protein